MKNKSHTIDFLICVGLNDEQQLDPRLYPTLCKRLRFRMSPRGYKSWRYFCEIELAGPYCSVLQTPIHEVLDLRDELLCASLQYEIFTTIVYHVTGRLCLHILNPDEISFISEAIGAVGLRCNFYHVFYSRKHGREVDYVTNQTLTDQDAYRNSCHAFLLPAGTNCEFIAEHLLSRVGDADELDWDDQDIPGTCLSGIIGVEFDEVDAWLEKLPAHAASNIPAVSGESTIDNAASLLLLFQTNDGGYPWTLPKTLLDFLSAHNLELCMLLVLETTYDGIQV